MPMKESILFLKNKMSSHYVDESLFAKEETSERNALTMGGE